MAAAALHVDAELTQACATLGIPPTDAASSEKVSAAFRKMARQYHPDKFAGKNFTPEEEDRRRTAFAQLREAQQVLTDRIERHGHVLKAMSGSHLFQATSNFLNSTSLTFENVSGSRSLFSSVDNLTRHQFGQPAATADAPASAAPDPFRPPKRAGAPLSQEAVGRPPKQARSEPARGPTLAMTVKLSFEEAALGTTKVLLFPASAPCEACASASLPGATMSAPPGVTIPGTAYRPTCADCGGKGVKTENRRERIVFPRGIRDGWQRRIHGKGGVAASGGAPGDLLLKVEVADHPFYRWGPDLASLDCHMTVQIGFGAATFGGQVQVQTLHGESVLVDVPPGATSGKTARLEGAGFFFEDDAARKGDGIVHWELVPPEPATLSNEQRDVLKGLLWVPSDARSKFAMLVPES
jgi:DnaJ-class molecular chaperone